uniref:Alpha-and gamma-adaptin-binding protein p34 n=1 Tax=Nyssomyia neivai TaxID=330878 RepID=A0A1L8DDD5_9DIPT
MASKEEKSLPNVYSVVLVVNHSGPLAEDVIKNIRQKSPTEDVLTLKEDPKSQGYLHHIVTKYFETDLLFVPIDTPLESCPQHLISNAEAVLICFDATKRDFLKYIPKYANFLKNHQIELGILLCEQLCDESDGITYQEAKQCSKELDVIELSVSGDSDEETDEHNPTGYDELHQALKSFLWASADVTKVYHHSHPYTPLDLQNDDIDDEDVATSLQEDKESTQETHNMSEDQITAELANYERLLSEVMQFRSTTSTWSRNERLTYAHQFANLFDEILNIDSYDDSEADKSPDK